jgi:hypothetical protein
MYSRVHPSAYITPCVASNSGIELAKDAPISAATMIAKPTSIEGVANMPQLCVAAYGCLEGIWLPTLGHCCLSSTAYIDDSHYLDTISNNAVIINAHLCSHSEQKVPVSAASVA